MIAGYILLIGLITTIIYVRDYHPLMVGRDRTTAPSQNSIRTASVQDYNTQSEASALANIVKDNLSVNISIVMYNYQAFLFPDSPTIGYIATIKYCYDQFGNDCTFQFSEYRNKSTAGFEMRMAGPIHFTETEITETISTDAYFAFATIEISTSFEIEGETKSPSTAKYLLLPGENKVLTGIKHDSWFTVSNLALLRIAIDSRDDDSRGSRNGTRY